MLGVMPDFSPGLDDPPRFVRMVAQLKRELSRTTRSSVSKMNESLMGAPETVIVVTGEQIPSARLSGPRGRAARPAGFDISRSNGSATRTSTSAASGPIPRAGRCSWWTASSRTTSIPTRLDLPAVSSTNIDRVEVVYGPASTMYGANAFLGVINVITKDPDDVIAEGKRIGADVQAGGGAWSTKFIDATVAGRYRGATMSLTGRVQVDEWDLSTSRNWTTTRPVIHHLSIEEQTRPSSCSAQALASSPASVRRPSVPGSLQPDHLDQAALKLDLNGRPIRYSELTDDWMISGRLKVKTHRRSPGMEETGGRDGRGTDMEIPGALNGNLWTP